MKKLGLMLILLAFILIARPLPAQEAIKKSIQAKIDKLTSAKTLDAKLKALSDLKVFIDNSSDAIDRSISDLNDDIEALQDDLTADSDKMADEKDVQKTQQEIKKKLAEIDKKKKENFVWNFYEVKFEPLFNLFLDEKNETKMVSNKTNCENIEAKIREKSPIKNIGSSQLDTIKIAHEMCDLSN